MVERLAARFGTTPTRLLMIGWVLGAVLLLGGLALVLTGAGPAAGFILFILGVIVTMTVAVNLLRLRAGDPGPGKPRRSSR